MSPEGHGCGRKSCPECGETHGCICGNCGLTEADFDYPEQRAMSDIEQEARAEAYRRFTGDTIVDETTGETVPFDDYGYAETERKGFIAGAVWAASRPASPARETATEEMVERAARAYWLASMADLEGDLPNYDWEASEREQYMWTARIVLEAALTDGNAD